MCQVKGHIEAFSHFGLPGRLDGLQRAHTHPKCCVDVQEGYCVGTKGIRKKGQGQVTKGHYKMKVTNMPCDTCFLGNVARRYRWWPSFDPLTSSNLNFDGGQVKVRSNKVTFSNQYFLQKKYIFLALNFLKFPHDSRYVISFLLQSVELRKVASQKMTSVFRYIL